MTVHEQVNTFLVDIFGQINKLEQRALATGLNDDVSITEMHIMEKIGEAGSSRMTDIARALDVTLATLTVACDRMQKKDLIERTRAEKDRRVVRLEVTEVVAQALRAYDSPFEKAVRAIEEKYTPAQLADFCSILDDFSQEYMKGF